MSENESYEIFTRVDRSTSKGVRAASNVALDVLEVLNRPDIKESIKEGHHVGASSHLIQSSILRDMEILGFTSERKGLFADFKVAGLRPDYFKPLDDGGILFEVERGKTLANNMDLLDVWKTHICKEAKHLFLLVPLIRETEKGGEQKIFNSVTNRIATFFDEKVDPIDVESVHIFGY
jgi:hypothetical protein